MLNPREQPWLSFSGLKDAAPPMACARFPHQSSAYTEFGSGPSEKLFLFCHTGQDKVGFVCSPVLPTC